MVQALLVLVKVRKAVWKMDLKVMHKSEEWNTLG